MIVLFRSKLMILNRRTLLFDQKGRGLDFKVNLSKFSILPYPCFINSSLWTFGRRIKRFVTLKKVIKLVKLVFKEFLQIVVSGTGERKNKQQKSNKRGPKRLLQTGNR